MPQKKKEVKSLLELRLLAEDFLCALGGQPRKTNATLVTLSGELGSGKTAFTKEAASLLGIVEMITSPTFILEKLYPIPTDSLMGNRFTKLIHIDAYRLESPEELKALDFTGIMENPFNLIFLEWPERVATVLPADAIKISFEYVSESVRVISGTEL